jgi:hypothetical protein
MNAARAASTQGVVFVHSCPSAVAPHVEWAIGSVMGVPVHLEWSAQPVAPGQLRAEASWSGPVGTASRIAAALRSWSMLRFEVTEEPTAAADGERLSYLPGRGFHRSVVSVSGDLMVSEERLRGLLARARSADELVHGVHELLGSSWDAELEPYRQAGDGSLVSLLHNVV